MGVKTEGAVKDDTTVSWTSAPGAASYTVWWRETSEAHWSHHKDAGAAISLLLPHVNIDDWFFGVSAVSADGWESPVEFPGPVGAFQRVAAPAKP